MRLGAVKGSDPFDRHGLYEHKLSIDNLLMAVYSIYMSTTECQDKDTLKKRLKMRFVMQSNMGGR